MTFLPKKDILSLEEMVTLCDAFIQRGVKRIRLTGGEPLVRKGIDWLLPQLGDRLQAGLLEELTLTTNGTQLTKFAPLLYQSGVRRINVSLDSLNPDLFARITRRNQLEDVLKGIQAAKDAGLQVKINTVAQKGVNDQELSDIFNWCMREGLDLTLIETMPMGDVSGSREDTYFPLSDVVDTLKTNFTIEPTTYRTGGPARYYSVAGTEQKLGLITPLSRNFCDGCNRVRITCTGRIYMCLGQDDHVDLMQAMRSDSSGESLDNLLDTAMGLKPKGHDFSMKNGKMTGKVSRHMSHTGG
ncbi:cyclic pyranopterin monophosphate synthase [Kordiimonas sediminis]|uniref:Cyclic pyranopterin monophosphate synthase n=2 Tax=Kordiimonas sediminis TaxID=1735581 RepID=A0A919E8G7_9PROT|nr:cyclic pyranopterin monophosphate synthase [Kordiimonas sediminis]